MWNYDFFTVQQGSPLAVWVGTTYASPVLVHQFDNEGQPLSWSLRLLCGPIFTYCLARIWSTDTDGCSCCFHLIVPLSLATIRQCQGTSPATWSFILVTCQHRPWHCVGLCHLAQIPDVVQERALGTVPVWLSFWRTSLEKNRELLSWP